MGYDLGLLQGHTKDWKLSRSGAQEPSEILLQVGLKSNREFVLKGLDSKKKWGGNRRRVERREAWFQGFDSKLPTLVNGWRLLKNKLPGGRETEKGRSPTTLGQRNYVGNEPAKGENETR